MGQSKIRRRGLVGVIFGAAATLVLAGCTSASTGETAESSAAAPAASEAASSAPAEGGDSSAAAMPTDVTIGMVSFSAASPGVKLYADTIIQQAEALGWEVKYVDTAGDAVAAVNQVKQWASEGVDAIINDTIPAQVMTEAVAAANDAGIPYFSVAAGYTDGVTNEVTANEYVSGAQLASALVDAMGREGNILQLTWNALEPVNQRNLALQAVVEGTPGVEIVKSHELKVPGWAEDAYREVSNYLTTNQDVQAIWMGWDDFAPDVVRAVEEAGLSDQIIIAGFDLDNAAADLLRADGAFKMSNALNIPAEAVSTIQSIGTVLQGGTVPPIIYVPNCLATPENIPATGGRDSNEFWVNCYSKPLELQEALS